MNARVVAGLSVIALILGLGAGLLSRTGTAQELMLQNFAECEAAGYPIMESYPRQCAVPGGQTFVEDISVPEDEPLTTSGCLPAGCSAQLCVEAVEAPNIMTTCEMRPAYACYQKAVCERQATGRCGWTESEELRACITHASDTAHVDDGHTH